MRPFLLSLISMLAIAGCGPATHAPGVVRVDRDNPLVSIGAGSIDMGRGNGWGVRYVVDRATETCWIMLYESLAELDCCKLRRVERARAHLTWLNDATCTPAAVMAPLATGPQP